MNEPRVTPIVAGFVGSFILTTSILRYQGAIDWPWYMIFAPIWLPIVMVFCLAVVVGISVALTDRKEPEGGCKTND